MAMDSDYGEVDKWIATLNECKQLSENEVRKLTELVRASLCSRVGAPPHAAVTDSYHYIPARAS